MRTETYTPKAQKRLFAPHTYFHRAHGRLPLQNLPPSTGPIPRQQLLLTVYARLFDELTSPFTLSQAPRNSPWDLLIYPPPGFIALWLGWRCNLYLHPQTQQLRLRTDLFGWHGYHLHSLLQELGANPQNPIPVLARFPQYVARRIPPPRIPTKLKHPTPNRTTTHPTYGLRSRATLLLLPGRKAHVPCASFNEFCDQLRRLLYPSLILQQTPIQPQALHQRLIAALNNPGPHPHITLAKQWLTRHALTHPIYTQLIVSCHQWWPRWLTTLSLFPEITRHLLLHYVLSYLHFFTPTSEPKAYLRWPLRGWTYYILGRPPHTPWANSVTLFAFWDWTPDQLDQQPPDHSIWAWWYHFGTLRRFGRGLQPDDPRASLVTYSLKQAQRYLASLPGDPNNPATLFSDPAHPDFNTWFRIYRAPVCVLVYPTPVALPILRQLTLEPDTPAFAPNRPQT